jgi:hypothetical protein
MVFMPLARVLVPTLALLAVLPSAPTVRAAEVDFDLVEAERLVKAAGGQVDGPGLIAFFRQRTPAPDDARRLERAVRQLGDEDFSVREAASRELIAAGRFALPFLRPALNDADLEVVRRAQDCVKAIQATPFTEQMLAASLLLTDRQPAGAAEALLAYLPFAEDDDIESGVLAALVRVGLKDGRPLPAVTAALTDDRPPRRAAAAHLLGRSTAPEKGPLLRLLRDADPRVRFEAAFALLRCGQTDGLSALVLLLNDAPAPLVWQVEDLLLFVADGKGPGVYLSDADVASRRRSRDAWEDWRKGETIRVDADRLRTFEPARGLTLVCEYDGVQEAAGSGRVVEYGRDGRVRWQLGGLDGVNDVHLLPGGHLLIAERNGGRVTERDRKGNILWEFQAGSPIVCQRLPNGNTLVGTFTELAEVTRDRQRVHTHSHKNGFRHARRLPNGHIVYVSGAGDVVELDADWKAVRTVKPVQELADGAAYWSTVQLLPSGRFLVAYGGQERVVELDESGKVAWSASQPHCTCAVRLNNGNTLIASFEERRVVEVDRDGKVIARLALQGRPFTIRRY